MSQFRSFLSGTDGETNCQFWLDVQQLLQRLHTGQVQGRDMAQFVNHLQRHYIIDGATYSLSREIRDKLTREFCYLHHHTPVSDLRHSHSRQLQVLVEAQREAIASLRCYWYRMYEMAKRKLCGVKGGKTAEVRKQSVSPNLPAIVGDRKKLEFTQQLTTTTIALPHINGRERNDLSTERLSRVSSLETKPLFAPSTTTLFPLSDLPSSSPLAEGDFQHLAPFLTGSLRADFLAGSPLLSHLSRHQRSSAATNYLLFWWSAELLFTLDEMRRWQGPAAVNQLKSCGSPFSNELIPTATNPRGLVQLFLKKGSPHSIELPDQTRQELVQLLPKGLGQSLLISVQELAAKVS